MKNNKQAVSLIVLVITIIVMVILAGTIILTINNTGIMGKAQSAVDATNLKEVQTLAELKWAEAFLDGNTTQESLEREVKSRLQAEEIDLSKYIITVTDEGVEVSAVVSTPVPEQWQENVIAIVDDVPIPKGFVASQATGENTKNGGLVIYEGTEPVTNANVETAKRTRNQYVWVPVPKEDFTTKFVRQNFGKSYTISNTLGTNTWEVVLDTTTNMPLSTQDPNYVTAKTLAEVQAMYESVKEYEGFYIARYEAGIDTQRTSNTTLVKGTSVYSMMGKIPYTYIPWGTSQSDDTNGAVEVARSMYPETDTNYGVVSTLTYGVQWDRTLDWWLEVGAKDGKGNTITSLTNSTSYGNYKNHVIAAGDLNSGAKYAVYSNYYVGSYQATTENSTKESSTEWALSTGALKVARVNNICDMAGNMHDWTMDGSSSDFRRLRGGNFDHNGSDSPVSNRHTHTPNYASDTFGFRSSLYIKK